MSATTIGIIGGGQLGRMLAMAAARLNFRIIVLEPQSDCPAAQLASEQIVAPYDDPDALNALARACQIVTYEFENVPVAPLAAISENLLAPTTRALEIAQDRVREKRFIEDLGGRPAPYAAIDADSELQGAIERTGTPGILKTRRDG